jgi:hypothetical protein
VLSQISRRVRLDHVAACDADHDIVIVKETRPCRPSELWIEDRV